ncbi:MAG: ComEC/Rec2 family competence protein, partial [Spirochaetes bacterium]|nr:ComEC/Rec2 family competence protein [Spirochaetota bacterium]
MIKKGIIFITIAYIIGLALGFQLDPSFQRLSAFGLYSLFFFMIGAGSYFLSFKYNKILMFTALGLAAVYFGLYQYTQAMDTSSPEHIVHSLDKTGFGETTIRGVVTEDPDIRPTYINLIVQPYEVQADPPFGKFKKVKKGKVIIRLTSSLKQYYQFDYADKIEVRGNFEPNAEDNNPGIFDQQSFYIHQNIWGRMAVKDDRNITLIGKQYPNKIIEWSYLIKDKMLLTIKKTMRFPESAFLGGVTLGLRSGLSYETQEEFRRTGIAHVLAVSGLHVGFIYILLWSLFGLFKIPKKISAVPIMFLLLLFVFITGARPATVRAAMMVSILIVFTSFLKGKLQNDLLVSLAITALIYLVFINPLMLVEASFVMSFTAILSIALFAGPISHLLTRYVKGYTFLAFITTAVLLTTILMTPYLAHLLFSNTFFLILFILIIFGLFKISLKLNQKNPHFNIGIAKMGPFIIGFMGVQFGITLGNVFPISGIYFQRFAISGLYANWIAIPLIGVIVQLGMIAGILGFLFTPLALVINAANFIFAKFFLGMAHFFAVYFPYPVVPKPTALQILLYYTVICILIWYPRIKTMIKDAYYRVILLWEKHELRKDMIILFASLGCIVIIGSSYIFQNLLPSNRFKMTFIDTKALGRFGDGNAFLLECPGNKNILINAGPGYFNFNNFVLGVSVGETVIRPMLSSKRITTLEGVILQNLDPACIGGVPDVLENFNVKQLYSYYSLDKIAKQVEENLKWWTIVNENDFNRYTGELTKGQRVNLTSAEKVEIKNLIRSSENSSSEKTEMINALFKKDIPEETSSRILQTLNSIRTKRREKEEPYLNAIAIILGEPDLKEKKDTLRIIGKIAQLLKAKKIGFTRIKKGSEIDLGRKVKIKVLYPSDTVPAGDSSDKNLILMAMAEDKKILIAGNATPFAVNYV